MSRLNSRYKSLALLLIKYMSLIFFKEHFAMWVTLFYPSQELFLPKVSFEGSIKIGFN